MAGPFFPGGWERLGQSLYTMIEYTKRYYSGICICGCKWESHHISYMLNKEYVDKAREVGDPPQVPGECCKYGFNESGGMKYNKDTGEWEDHCHRYIDKDDPYQFNDDC